MSIYRLSCDHLVTSGAREKISGDDEFCSRCNTYREIFEVEAEVRLVCGTCRYGRRFGAGLLTARHAADAHSRRFPTHVVRIVSGSKVLEVRNPHVSLGKLPFGVDMVPPF